METIRFILKLNLIELKMKKLIKISFLTFLFISRTMSFSQTTPNGTDVSGDVDYYPELTQNEIDWINNQQQSVFPNVSKIAEPTRTYNCHGYAWIKHDGGGDYWLTTPGDDKFWLDNSYIQTSNTMSQNLRVSYQGDHSAVTTSTPGVCVSKWGPWGRYIHNTTNVPLDYQPNNPLTYYERCYTPNLQNMTYDGNFGPSVNTVNFVSVGFRNVFTNIPSNILSTPISWNPNNGSVGFSANGTNNINGSFNLGSGQSVTFYMNVTGFCGSGTRSPTFVAQSGYRMYSSGNVKDVLYVGFDNVEYLEILPSSISIYDDQTGNQELLINMADIFEKKQFDSEKRIAIDVKKLKRGVKIVNFIYPKLDGSEKGLVERKSDRIILVD